MASVVLPRRGMKKSVFVPRRSLPPWGAEAGIALVESVIAMALVSLMLSFMFATNAHLTGLLRQGKQSTYASQMIQERVETLRSALWDQVTDPAKLATLLQPATVTASSLPGVTETIKVEPLVNTANVSGQCVRVPGGNVASSGAVLTSQKSVKVTLSTRWVARDRVRERVSTTILTNGGL